jgi:hypothetical protein
MLGWTHPSVGVNERVKKKQDVAGTQRAQAYPLSRDTPIVRIGTVKVYWMSTEP